MSPRFLPLALWLLAAGCGARDELLDGAAPYRPIDPPTDGSPRIHVVASSAVTGEDVGIFRFDDMDGARAIQYDGPPGLHAPCGVAIDEGLRIHFGHRSEIVRMNNMAGDGLVTFGRPGAGVGGFASLQGVALDAAGRIHAVDADLHRVVRMDDMTGAGWVALGGPEPGSGVGRSGRT